MHGKPADLLLEIDGAQTAVDLADAAAVELHALTLQESDRPGHRSRLNGHMAFGARSLAAHHLKGGADEDGAVAFTRFPAEQGGQARGRRSRLPVAGSIKTHMRQAKPERQIDRLPRLASSVS